MLRRMLGYAYRNLLPSPVRKSLDLFEQLRAQQAESMHVPAEKRILVLAPHPDDDIFGCGGTLHRCRLNGSAITSVYMTDGGQGSGAESGDLVRIRRSEAERAAAIIGIEDLVFLENRDGQLRRTPAAVAEIARLLERTRPDAVFLPFLLDNHPDHRATNDIFVEAGCRAGGDPVCYGYEVWTSISFPNCVVDITGVLSVKMSAIEQHASQIKDLDLLNAFLGISQYRSVTAGLRNGNAEAFVRCTLREYRRLREIAA